MCIWQEGRGIGLANKVAAYALQDGGLDTVDANRHLGFGDDLRSYEAVEHILADMGIRVSFAVTFVSLSYISGPNHLRWARPRSTDHRGRV